MNGRLGHNLSAHNQRLPRLATPVNKPRASHADLSSPAPALHQHIRVVWRARADKPNVILSTTGTTYQRIDTGPPAAYVEQRDNRSQ